MYSLPSLITLSSLPETQSFSSLPDIQHLFIHAASKSFLQWPNFALTGPRPRLELKEEVVALHLPVEQDVRRVDLELPEASAARQVLAPQSAGQRPHGLPGGFLQKEEQGSIKRCLGLIYM